MSIKGTRLPLKEKFVQIYESILLEGDEPWKTNDNFWDELFLLKVTLDTEIYARVSEVTKKVKRIFDTTVVR